MSAEEFFQVPGDLLAIEAVGDQGKEAIAAGQVLGGNDLTTARSVFGSVDGPDQPGPEPLNVFHGGELVLPDLPNQRAELATGDGSGEALMDLPGPAGAPTAMLQLLQEAIKLVPVQRHGFFGAGGLTERHATALT